VSLKNPFEYQKPDELQISRIETIREGCDDLMNELKRMGPATAMQTLALRKLEEFSMWANKYIVFDTPKAGDNEVQDTAKTIRE